MPTKFRELVKILKADGWEFDHATGSHYTFMHATKGKISVPFHGDNKELRTGTLKAILNKAGLR
jgi:predicted RNA binding protein YcfA (HicA-like mRNA interferase family)